MWNPNPNFVWYDEGLDRIAFDAAEEFHPLTKPLLTGSAVLLGKGQDLDVVVRVQDCTVCPAGWVSCSKHDREAVVGLFRSYRKGYVNIIAVESEAEFAAWSAAHAAASALPAALIRHKDDRAWFFELIKGHVRSAVEDLETVPL